ncbi:MAG: CinA family protein [Pseudomonadota bacterium]
MPSTFICINDLLDELQQKLVPEQKKIALAESCTGGKIAAAITDRAGSSLWFERAYVTYSDQAKMDLLAVKEKTLEQYGAVSEQVASEMAIGCLVHSDCDFSLSVTGIAGPGGGSIEKPVGTVWFAWAAYKNKQILVKSMLQQFAGDRHQIREQSVNYALSQLIEYIDEPT